MAGTSTLSDEFSAGSLDTTKWPIAYGTSVTLTGGRLRISCDTTYAGVQSDDVYTLDSFSVEPFPPALNSAPADCYGTVMAQSAAQPAGTTVGFFIDRVAGILHCVVWSGYFDATAVSVTYNATNHAWLHFTYNGTSFVWQSSATQGGTRTTLRTLASGLPAWRNNADFSIYFDTHRDGGASNFYEIGAINPSTNRTTSGTAALVATATATRSTTRTRAASAALVATATATRTTSRTRTGTAALVPTATASRSTTRTRTATAAVAATATATRTTSRILAGTAPAAVTATASRASVRTSAGTAVAVPIATGTRSTTRPVTGIGGAVVTASATTEATENHTTSGTAALVVIGTASHGTARPATGVASTVVTATATRSTARVIIGTAAFVMTATSESGGGDPPMSQTIFTDQEPFNLDATDATPYSMGTYFTPAVDGTVTHIRWFFPLSAQPGGAAVKANLFRNSDSLKLGGADALFDSPGLPGEWNEVALSTPVEVVGGTTYCATILTPGRYIASVGAASPWPITNGDLSAAAAAGRFVADVTGNVEFPSSSFNNGCYFVDVVFTTDVPPETHTTSGTASLTVAATAVAGGSRPTARTASATVTASASSGSSRAVTGTATVAPAATTVAAGQHATSGTATATVTARATTGGTEDHTSAGTATVATTARASIATTRVLARSAPVTVIARGVSTTGRSTAGTASVVVTAGRHGGGVHPGPPLTSATRPVRITSVRRSTRLTSYTRPRRNR